MNVDRRRRLLTARPRRRAAGFSAGSDDREVDLIVVGAGGAGLAAAAAAAPELDVVVLEKSGRIGGTTSLAVGSLTAAGTRLQRRAGIDDRAEDFAEDLADCDPTGQARPVLNMLAREAAATVGWLESLGVVFVGPYPEPPNRVPRMHNAVPGGRSYVQRLSGAARRHGAQIRCWSDVRELIRDGRRVTGVSYLDALTGLRHQLRARAGVILATGDFSGSAPLRRRYLPAPAAAARPVNEGSVGDGHGIAARAGADLQNMGVVLGPQLRFPPPPKPGWTQRLPTWRWLSRLGAYYVTRAPSAALAPIVKQLLTTHMSPSPALLSAGAVLVDAGGRRLAGSDNPAEALALHGGGTGYLIGDAAIAARFSAYPWYISTAPGIAYAYLSDYRRGRPDLVHAAADAAELARRLHMDPRALAAAVRDLRGRLFALGPVHAMLTVTEGGAAIDDRCRILDATADAIPGLYGAGGVAQGGLVLRIHGTHLAWALSSGRIAARTATAELGSHV